MMKVEIIQNLQLVKYSCDYVVNDDDDDDDDEVDERKKETVKF